MNTIRVYVGNGDLNAVGPARCSADVDVHARLHYANVLLARVCAACSLSEEPECASTPPSLPCCHITGPLMPIVHCFTISKRCMLHGGVNTMLRWPIVKGGGAQGLLDSMDNGPHPFSNISVVSSA